MQRITSRGWTLASRATVGVLLAVHALLAWAMRVPGLATGHDDALYIALGRALRHGSYVELPIVGHPAHAMYPPLYPALLGALGVTDPAHVWIGVLANIALSVVMLALVAGVAARLSPWLAVTLTLACAANPMLLYVASGVHSEPMLAAAAALAISVAATTRRDARALALIGLMAIVAALSRSIGLALVVSTFALLLFERRWRALALFSVVAALTVGSWLVWTVRAPRLDAGRSYIADTLYVPATGAAVSSGASDSAAVQATPRVAAPEDMPSSAATTPVPARSAPATSPNAQSNPAPNAPAPDTTAQLPQPPGRAATIVAEDSLELDARRAAAAREEQAAERVATARAAAGARVARTLADRALRNVPAYLTRELPTVLAIPTRAGTLVDNAVWLGAFLLTALAGVGVLLRRAWLLVAYVATSAGVLALWPYVDKRFLAPLIPLVVLAMLTGAWWMAERTLGARWARAIAMGLALLLAAFALRADADRLARVAECDRAAAPTSPGCFNDEQRHFFAAVAAAKQLTPDSARFLVSKEATFYLLSDREAVRESEAVALRTPEALRDYLRRHGAEYILLSHLHLDQWALAATLLPQCRQLQLMASFGEHVALLRVPPTPGDSVSGSPRVAVPDAETANEAGASAATPDSSRAIAPPARDGCDAIARWNAGSWDEPPVRIW